MRSDARSGGTPWFRSSPCGRLGCCTSLLYVRSVSRPPAVDPHCHSWPLRGIANMRMCAGTPRPLTRSTTCACRAVVVTSTPGTARSTHVRRVDSRWSSLGTTSRRPVGATTPGGPRLRQFLGRGCATRVSRCAGVRGSRSSGHERAPKSGCGGVLPAALGCRRLRHWLLGIPTTSVDTRGIAVGDWVEYRALNPEPVQSRRTRRDRADRAAGQSRPFVVSRRLTPVVPSSCPLIFELRQAVVQSAPLAAPSRRAT